MMLLCCMLALLVMKAWSMIGEPPDGGIMTGRVRMVMMLFVTSIGCAVVLEVIVVVVVSVSR